MAGKPREVLSALASVVWQVMIWPITWIPSIVSAVLIPIVLLLSIPVAAFAIFTTAVAFWILLLRVAFVYFELLTALLWAYLTPASPRATPVAPLSPEQERSPRSRRVSHSSSGSSGLQMRPFGPSDSSITLPGPLPSRDYEGVGGWRVQEDNEVEEALWLNINSRVQTPSLPYQWPQSRSQANLSRAHSGFNSPDAVYTPLVHRTRPTTSGSDSPEGYFNTPKLFVSGGDRTSKVSFEDQNPSMTGSTASLSSIKITRFDAA